MNESDECFRTLQDELKDDACEGAFLPGHGPKLVGGKKGLSAVDALYFMTVTASTVGYGDVTPQSYLGKCFGCLYFPFAVAIMSRTIMSIALIPTVSAAVPVVESTIQVICVEPTLSFS